MPTRHRRKSSLSFYILPFLLTVVALYFGWQSTRGEYGQRSRQTIKIERADQETDLADLTVQRKRLEDRVGRLRTDALDADLLDERARAQLNVAHPNEIVIVHRPAADADRRLAARDR